MRAFHLTVFIAAIALISGCGQKGPLYLPDANTEQAVIPAAPIAEPSAQEEEPSAQEVEVEPAAQSKEPSAQTSTSTTQAIGATSQGSDAAAEVKPQQDDPTPSEANNGDI